jgi:ribonuclease T2
MRLLLLVPACLAALLGASAGTALAQVPMTGRFIAEARCPALPEIGAVDNPGAVATEPGREYRLLARTTDPATHYLMELPDAEPPLRWVAIGCGRVETEAQAAGLRPAGAAIA